VSLVHCCAIRNVLLHHSYTMLMLYSSLYCRVANLAFLKPDYENLAVFNAFGFFTKNKKTDKSWLLFVTTLATAACF